MTAKVIADSLSPNGDRLTTVEVRFHRFVLAEFNTHRVFSRNSASSRAIPAKKMIQRLRDEPAFPISWPSEKPGMQGGESLGEEDENVVRDIWHQAMQDAIGYAEQLQAVGLHKSVTNRLLEPFMWHTAIVSSTEWENFFKQRCSPLAQPEIRIAAEAIEEVYRASLPRALEYGEWHLPYLDADDLLQCHIKNVDPRAVSVARCARVSYLTHDGKRDVELDLDLYLKLVSADPPHWSPLEHVATPSVLPTLGNFDGWLQLRHTPVRP